MKKNILLLIILASVVFSACDKFIDNDIQIVSGTVCGWCAGADSLVITDETTWFRIFNPCTLEVDHEYDQQIATDKENWNELIEALDWSEFKKIDLNTCAVCVDGCDTYIRIKYKGEAHYIRYAGFNEEELEPVKDFIEKLDEIRNSLREEAQQE
jgi:hypothetical protein